MVNVSVMNQVKAATEPLCTDLPRKQLDKLFDIFRRSYNHVHVFANKKLEFTLKEQENDFQQREEEINYLEGKNKSLKEEINRLHELVDIIAERGGSLAKEVSREILSRAYILEEKKYLDEMQVVHVDKKNPKTLITCFNHLGTIANFLASVANDKARKGSIFDSFDNSVGSNGTRFGTNGVPINEKIKKLVQLVTDFIEKVSVKSEVSGEMVR